LFNTKVTILQLYHGENKLYLMKMKMKTALY